MQNTGGQIHYMANRNDAVLRMQISLVPVLAEAWKVSYANLSSILKKYDILHYIETCYEQFNSTGNQGIVEEIEEFIALQGGRV